MDIDGHACDHADRFAKNILLRVAMGVEIIVSFMTLSLLAVLGWNLRGLRVTVHQNLKVGLFSKDLRRVKPRLGNFLQHIDDLLDDLDVFGGHISPVRSERQECLFPLDNAIYSVDSLPHL